jgi:hypothetical protein
VNVADRRNIIDQVARNEIPTSDAEEGADRTAASQEPSAMAQPTHDDASSFAVEGNPAREIIKQGLQLQRHASQFSLMRLSIRTKLYRHL